MKPPETSKNECSEIRAITQEEVDEQIKNFIAPLTRQPEDLIRLVLRMTFASHPNFLLRLSTSASSNARGCQPDIIKIEFLTSNLLPKFFLQKLGNLDFKSVYKTSWKLFCLIHLRLVYKMWIFTSLHKFILSIWFVFWFIFWYIFFFVIRVFL